METNPNDGPDPMQPEDKWQTIKNCLGEALDLEDGERDAFLKVLETQLPGVAEKVKQLLRSLAESGSFMTGVDSSYEEPPG